MEAHEGSQGNDVGISERARRTVMFVNALRLLCVLFAVAFVAYGIYVAVKTGGGLSDFLLGVGFVFTGGLLPVVSLYALSYSVCRGLRPKTAVGIQAFFCGCPLVALILAVVSAGPTTIAVAYGAATLCLAVVLGIGIWALRAPADS